MTLIAHLRGYLGFLSAPGELPGFINGPRKRLLNVDMLAESHGGEGDVRVWAHVETLAGFEARSSMSR
jgi:hypothetical protein